MTKYEFDKVTNKDHVATPRWVVEDIYDRIHIKNFKMVWFPFNNYDSKFKLKADELKLQYKATHIFDNLEQDFFTTDPPAECDLMISNPPFKQQNEILARSVDLFLKGKVKAVCLLLPLATLETRKREKILDPIKDKLSILVFTDRVVFDGHTSGFNRPLCWVIIGITMPYAIDWIKKAKKEA